MVLCCAVLTLWAGACTDYKDGWVFAENWNVSIGFYCLCSSHLWCLDYVLSVRVWIMIITKTYCKYSKRKKKVRNRWNEGIGHRRQNKLTTKYWRRKTEKEAKSESCAFLRKRFLFWKKKKTATADRRT